MADHAGPTLPNRLPNPIGRGWSCMVGLGEKGWGLIINEGEGLTINDGAEDGNTSICPYNVTQYQPSPARIKID